MTEDVLVQDVRVGDVLVHDPHFAAHRVARDWPLNWTVLEVGLPSPGMVTLDLMSHEKSPWGGKKIRGYHRGWKVTVQRA